MNIKKALKEKNKLVGVIAQEFAKVSQYNSLPEGEKAPYDAKDSLESWLGKIDELISLKTKIHKANVKVQEKIFRLSELKSIIAQLKRLDCSEGKISSTGGRRRFYAEDESSAVNKVVSISIIERDNLVKKYEDEIEKLQEELDLFNSKTKL
jgi:hypothetical protein